MRRTAAALILIISLLMAGSAIAGPFEDSVAAFDRGDYETAFRLLKPLAEQGNASAQYNLAFMYYEGKGVPKNYIEALNAGVEAEEGAVKHREWRELLGRYIFGLQE
jgi:hypothetical protein